MWLWTFDVFGHKLRINLISSSFCKNQSALRFLSVSCNKIIKKTRCQSVTICRQELVTFKLTCFLSKEHLFFFFSSFFFSPREQKLSLWEVLLNPNKRSCQNTIKTIWSFSCPTFFCDLSPHISSTLAEFSEIIFYLQTWNAAATVLHVSNLESRWALYILDSLPWVTSPVEMQKQ